MESRSRFFQDVRACRRREQKEWQGQKVAKVFTAEDDYPSLEHRALAARVANAMRTKVWARVRT